MKLRKLTLRGLIPFPQEVDVPIAELGDAQLVAVTGDNGSGKSTLLECIPGALYRTMPSRGLLSSVCNDAKSRVGVHMEVGNKEYVASVEIDAIKNKASAYLLETTFDGVDGNTHDLSPDGKVRTFTEAVAKHFPPQDVYLASAFGAQSGAGRFLDLDPADRRALLAKLIGIEKWQEIADAAGAKARDAKSALDVLKGKVAALESSGSVEQSTLDIAIEQLHDADVAAEKAEETHAAQQKLCEEWTSALQDIQWKISEAGTERTHAKEKSTAIAERLKTLRKEHGELEAKLADRGGLEETAAQAAGNAEEIRQRINASMRAEQDWRAEHEKWQADIRDRDRLITEASNRLSNAKAQAAALNKTVCGGEGEYAACELIKNAVDAKAMIQDVEKALEQVTGETQDPEPPKPELDYIPTLEQALKVATNAEKEIADAKLALAGMDAAAQRINDVAAGITVEEKNIHEQDALTVAADEKVRELEEERNKQNVVKPTPAKSGPVDVARTALQTKRDELARLEERRRVADEAEKALKETKAQIDASTADLDDWTTLQKATGKTGIQAYLLDASGPEISALTNDLLHSCFGSRFTVRLVTQAAASKKGQTKEIMDLWVLDNVAGTDGSASMKSGGERVILAEALSLAIAIFNTRRSSIPMADLFRDETSGALDPENARQYVSMLRKALALGNFNRCYFVSHVPEVQALADAELHVEGGKVCVR